MVLGALAGGVVLAAAGTYFSGPSFGPFASTFFVWVSLGAAMFATRPVIVGVLLVTGIAEGFVLYLQTAPSPISRWLLVWGACVVTSVTVDGVMTLLTRALHAEHAAREAADQSRHEAQTVGRELEEASRHKSEFLASMSHELRTPLNAIIGFSDVLAAQHFGELNERQAGYVGDVQEAGRHLLALINDILDLSKIESGSMELDARTFSLRDNIESALNLIRTRADAKGVALKVEMESDADEAFGDERRIKQVLANLFSNAVKFTPAGGSITVRATSPAGSTRVAVTDTGIGVAPGDLIRIFEDFQQVSDASTASEGTGLGLALCRRLIESHGGTLDVESTIGQGSTFSFVIPRH